jgi:Transmembrane secretion effector
MQQVLFAWLVVGELNAPARWVGIAQSASMIPNFLLILLGGAVADRTDRRGLLIHHSGTGAVGELRDYFDPGIVLRAGGCGPSLHRALRRLRDGGSPGSRSGAGDPIGSNAT